MRSVHDPNRDDASLKIMIFHVQQLGLLLSLHIVLPPSLLNLVSISSTGGESAN